MKNISKILVLLFLGSSLCSQSNLTSYPSHLTYIKNVEKPQLKNECIETWYCYEIFGNDTLKSYIIREKFNYKDKVVEIQYDRDGTLAQIKQTTYNNDSTITTNIKVIDEYGISLWESIKEYNNEGQIIKCTSKAQENDELYSSTLEKYEYNRSGNLISFKKFQNGSLLQRDSILYKHSNLPIQINRAYNKDGIETKIVYNYNLNNKYIVENISVYHKDKLIEKTSFPEFNRFEPDSIVIKKIYIEPERNARYSVETRRITTKLFNDTTRTKIEKYHDHELYSTWIQTTNSENEFLSIINKRSNKNEKFLIKKYEKKVLLPEQY